MSSDESAGELSDHSAPGSPYDTSSSSEDEGQPPYDRNYLVFQNTLVQRSLISVASYFTIEKLRSALPRELFCRAASYKCIKCLHCNKITTNMYGGVQFYQNKKCVSCRLRPMMCASWRGCNIAQAHRDPDIDYNSEPDDVEPNLEDESSDYAIICERCLGSNRGPLPSNIKPELQTRCRSCYNLM